MLGGALGVRRRALPVARCLEVAEHQLGRDAGRGRQDQREPRVVGEPRLGYVDVKKGKITGYQVNLLVTFILD